MTHEAKWDAEAETETRMSSWWYGNALEMTVIPLNPMNPKP